MDRDSGSDTPAPPCGSLERLRYPAAALKARISFNPLSLHHQSLSIFLFAVRQIPGDFLLVMSSGWDHPIAGSLATAQTEVQKGDGNERSDDRTTLGMF